MNEFFTSTKNKLVILLYHGVTRHKDSGIKNIQKKHIDENIFSEQIKFIKKNCHPISIDTWLDYLKDKSELPKNSVIITFDDGFKNNYSVAAPILDDNKVPAIFYISSGVISTQKMFWVDEIEDCIDLFQKKSLAIKLDRKVIFDTSSFENKFNTAREIKKWCKKSTNDEKNRVILDLKTLTKVVPSIDHSPNYEKLSWSELSEMNNSYLFSIGGHSLNHNILSSLNQNDLESEIQESIRLIKDNLKIELKHYSYPEGQKEHFNKNVINVLIKNRIECCPTAIHGVNNLITNPFLLKRIMIGIDGKDFPYFL